MLPTTQGQAKAVGSAAAEIFPPDIYYCKMDATLVALYGYTPRQARALRAASHVPRASPRCTATGYCAGAIALRESYIQYVPRDDLNKEERREIKYRDYWFQTRRKVAGHGFSFFFATTLQ